MRFFDCSNTLLSHMFLLLIIIICNGPDFQNEEFKSDHLSENHKKKTTTQLSFGTNEIKDKSNKTKIFDVCEPRDLRKNSSSDDLPSDSHFYFNQSSVNLGSGCDTQTMASQSYTVKEEKPLPKINISKVENLPVVDPDLELGESQERAESNNPSVLDDVLGEISVGNQKGKHSPSRKFFPLPNGGVGDNINCLFYCLKHCKSFMEFLREPKIKSASELCKKLSEIFEFLDNYENKFLTIIENKRKSDEYNKTWCIHIMRLFRFFIHKPEISYSYDSLFSFITSLIGSLDLEWQENRISHLDCPLFTKCDFPSFCLECGFTMLYYCTIGTPFIVIDSQKIHEISCLLNAMTSPEELQTLPSQMRCCSEPKLIPRMTSFKWGQKMLIIMVSMSNEQEEPYNPEERGIKLKVSLNTNNQALMYVLTAGVCEEDQGVHSILINESGRSLIAMRNYEPIEPSVLLVKNANWVLFYELSEEFEMNS